MYDGSCLRYVALWSVLSTRPAPPAAAARPTPHVYENEFNTDTTSSSLAPPPPPPPPRLWSTTSRTLDRTQRRVGRKSRNRLGSPKRRGGTKSYFMPSSVNVKPCSRSPVHGLSSTKRVRSFRSYRPIAFVRFRSRPIESGASPFFL